MQYFFEYDRFFRAQAFGDQWRGAPKRPRIFIANVQTHSGHGGFFRKKYLFDREIAKRYNEISNLLDWCYVRSRTESPSLMKFGLAICVAILVLPAWRRRHRAGSWKPSYNAWEILSSTESKSGKGGAKL